MPDSNAPTSVPAYANIMLPMDLDPTTEGRARLAIDLADRLSSRIIGVAAQPIRAPLYFEAAVEGIESILQIEERKAQEDVAKAEAVFRMIAGNRHNIEWHPAVTFALDHALEQARAADLIVAARPQRDQQAYNPMSIDGGDLVMDAGRPVLFVPPNIEHLSAKRIVVGWKDTRESRRAVWDALPLLMAAEEVLVVAVETWSDAASDVAVYLGSHGVKASAICRLQSAASVADDLVHIAETQLADLLVCGAYGHARTREWIFGGVTHDLLDHSPICCLMAH